MQVVPEFEERARKNARKKYKEKMPWIFKFLKCQGIVQDFSEYFYSEEKVFLILRVFGTTNSVEHMNLYTINVMVLIKMRYTETESTGIRIVLNPGI